MRRVYSAREIDSALSKKGFRRDNGHDHVFYYLTLANGRNAGIKTKISHGVTGETIDVNLTSLMARQLRLTKAQFLGFIDCTISEEDYRTILREQGEVV